MIGLRISHETLLPAIAAVLISPARRRETHNLAGLMTVRGRGPVHNRLGDIAQQQPALFVSIRRSVLAKGRDGSDLPGHHQALRPVACNVAGSEFQMRNRGLISAQIVAEARAWAEELTELEIKGPTDLEPAWRRLEARYGIPFATFWSLRYRKDLKDVWGSLHQMLRMAVEQERSSRAKKLAMRDEIKALVASTGG